MMPSFRRITYTAITVTLALNAITARAQEPACTGSDLSIAQATMKDTKKALDFVNAGLSFPIKSVIEKAATWLGIRSTSDLDEASKVLNPIYAFADNAVFLCAVNTKIKLGDVYAYVRPDKAFAIVLGAFFFQAPQTGFDSKLGILVHEMSHFALAGATKDISSGPTAAKALAATNPAAARRNADNYEYFVEAVIFNL
jgi:peptidyl-Lys metalloendopeptidase